MEGLGALILGLVALVIFGAGLYGLVLDVFHSHWMWAILDLVTGGAIAVLRGIGFFFGFIEW
ncbi:hypothetical protein V8N76_004527 [Salmonella enterica]